MYSLLLLLATAVMLPSAHAALPAAYLLCTDARLAPDVTVYYLQPLDSTTVHPITEPPVLDYDNTTSQLIFNTPGITSIKGMHAIFVENDRNNVALINTLTNPITNFYTLNTPSYSTSLNGSVKSPLAYSADLFTYVPSLDLYWRFVVGNELNTTTKIWNAVVSLYADPFRNQVPTFTVQWPISEDDEYGVMDITQNSDARQIYLSLSNWKQHGQNTIGQLMTYDIQNQKVIGNATCSTRMLLKYSASRKTLFGATLNTKASAGLQITSIVEVDPMTCKTRVLIDSSVLPAVVGAGLLEAFHDETGEWHFVWQKTYGGSSGSAFYSVNIATKKATSVMGLKYDPNNVVVSAIVSQYDGSSNFPNSNVNIDLINKIESE